jgi:hypothetical protein
MSNGRKVSKVVGLSLMIIIGLAGIVLWLLGVLPGYLVLPLETVPIVFGLIIYFTLVAEATRAREERLRGEGIPGLARVTEAWIMGKSGGAPLDMEERYKFEMEITVEGKAPYGVVHQQLVPHQVYHRVGKGALLPVKVDPENPEQVVILWDTPVIQTPRVSTLAGKEAAQFVASVPGMAEVIREARGQLGREKGSLTDRLRELEDAFEEGLISAEEYERKKAGILKEL